jgi:hypothetical protein
MASEDRARLTAQAHAVASACRQSGVPFVMGGGGAWPEAPEGARRLTAFGRFHALLRELGEESA